LLPLSAAADAFAGMTEKTQCPYPLSLFAADGWRYPISSMMYYHLRDDLDRATLGDFALPLGIEPTDMQPPMQGYTLTFAPGEDDDPDTYTFHVVISHERLKPTLDRVFTLLPPEVFPIVEIGSRDAYRNVDVYMGTDPIPLASFLETWQRLEPVMLEDATIAAGANSEDPFIEIFLDQWKSVAIHVPPAMREEVESLLQELDLEEVPQTWPDEDGPSSTLAIRPIIVSEEDTDPDIDDLLLDLRQVWSLELNVDPDTNIDDSGRELGLTLWHALVIVTGSEERTSSSRAQASGDPPGAYCSIWATAGSMAEMEELIATALDEHPEWTFNDIFTIDRVAFDSRPDELADLPPRRVEPDVHLVQFEPWQSPPEEARRA